MFKKSCKIFGLFLLLQFVSAQNFPPGVPPPKPAQQNDIKFHEPGEFQKQMPNRHNIHHKHGAKINFQDQDPQKAREHMKAHNKEKYVDVDNLSQPQLIMQHFRNFDLDKNGKIDGLEILKAAANMNDEHAHEEEENFDHFDFMEMAQETDETLQSYDENNDGYIHYGEFYRNHKKLLDAANK